MADAHEEEILGKAYDSRLMKRLLTYLRPYGWQVALSLVAIMVRAILDVLGPVLTAIAIDKYLTHGAMASKILGGQFTEPWSGKNPLSYLTRLLDPHLSREPLVGIAQIAGIYVALVVVAFFLEYAQTYFMQWTGQKVMFDLRSQLFRHLQHMHIGFFDKNPVGRLVTRVTTDVDALNEMFTAGFVAIFGDIFVLLGIVGVLFWMNWRMALVLFSITPLILLVSVWFRRGARITYRSVRVRIAAINAFLQEHISGMSTVQLFNREEKERDKFDSLNARHRDANIDSIFYYAVFYPLIELIETVGIALIVWYGGGAVIRGTLSIGALIAFFTYAQRFYEPISDLSEKYNILQAAMAASERVALVGHTGAGKTTVTALLLRFYEPQRGEIVINGVNIREYTLASLRALFAIVQQDFFLFTGNVAQNISLGDPAIGDDAVRQAAVRVQADRFISRLPQRYQSEVRERGAGFSVGEKQLLSFARALAFNPPVLILDEATSSIDTETELLIQEAIRTLMEGRTSIVIAHRLSTIRSADTILVFHHGEIRERGTHEELMRMDGVYWKLYEIQYRESVAATA